ncbi:Sporulation initiation phosphotransferase [Alteripontixanthobacter maritimus]|uniref:DNA-binding transcriptional regulator NtrC n=1 Tax=Alteripontixanthobacter maritimus TaxID=2161824 RepID=A0A369Q8U4_9SPHN|nr:nitrogen regulation protein NR(I) [Alteripontixanthobacter maritimus]RDC59975.1 Sporulation initiation phosphotransferase [Alteripontixanthobacter maritimus]
MPGRILLVEDDAAIATVITAALQGEGHTIDRCASIAERNRLLGEASYSAMLTDIMLEDGDGLANLADVQKQNPELPVIVLSAQNTLDTAVRASDLGAFEYFPKPFDLDELTRAVEQAVQSARAMDVGGQDESHSARVDEGGEQIDPSLPLVGRSPAMQGVFRMITRVLRNDLTVLILGESGTGKELVAQAIHDLGHRRTGPFVAVNAAAIPRELIESELFGHEKGAFTGATGQAIGKFEQASGGTLFLDEIGDMPAEAQTRLLRALQSGSIRRVGGRQDVQVDVRIVAATNRDLSSMVVSGQFREDLYYRLAVVPVQLPPLRDRRTDIPDLVSFFLANAARQGLPQRGISKAGLDLLKALDWPGNVRELQNMVMRLALMSRDETIDAQCVRDALEAMPGHAGADAAAPDYEAALHHWLAEARPADGTLYHSAQAAFERPLFEHALEQTSGNQLRAAQLLGINRNTLRKRLDDLEIDPDRFARRRAN